MKVYIISGQNNVTENEFQNLIYAYNPIKEKKITFK